MDSCDKDNLLLVKKAIHGNVNAYGTLITHCQDYLYRIAFLYVILPP